jgi:hypothetical protein
MEQRKEKRCASNFVPVYGDPHNHSTSLDGPNVESYAGVSMASRFKTGRTSPDVDEHTGRPTSCTIAETVARIQ